MALNFPNSPVDGQTYTFGSRSWTWSNTYSLWQATSTTVGYTGSLGYTGSTGSQGANSLYTVGNTTPISATPGDRWFHTDYGAELVYTYDGDSYQWVEISATGFLGATGYTGSAGYIGLDGYTGSRGATGFTGSIGSLGYTGSIGYTGSVATTLPLNYKTSAYVPDATDNGKLISITTGGITINTGVFSNGMNFSVHNKSGSNQTITSNGVTLYLAGSALTGNRTLAQRGICTIVCVDVDSFIISGPGIS